MEAGEAFKINSVTSGPLLEASARRVTVAR